MNYSSVLLAIAALGVTGLAQAEPEGKKLYVHYGCYQCHGDDAKAVTQKGMRPLAGMDADDVYYKTRKFVESRAHENVMAGCGSVPSAKDIKKISDYLATLPK